MGTIARSPKLNTYGLKVHTVYHKPLVYKSESISETVNEFIIFADNSAQIFTEIMAIYRYVNKQKYLKEPIHTTNRHKQFNIKSIDIDYVGPVVLPPVARGSSRSSLYVDSKYYTLHIQGFAERIIQGGF